MTRRRTTIKPSDWKWYGNAGHFCCGRWCRFHMLTEIGGFIVSTVGEFVHPRHSGGSEQAEADWLKKNWPGEDIGCGRKYETMVFAVTGHCDTIDCSCGAPLHDGSELDSDGYNTATAAAAGHMALCEKWAKVKP